MIYEVNWSIDLIYDLVVLNGRPFWAIVAKNWEKVPGESYHWLSALLWNQLSRPLHESMFSSVCQVYDCERVLHR